jgi:hypothetical protein
MRDDVVFGGRFHRREAEQPGMIADADRGLCFSDGLLRRTGKAGHHRQWALGPGFSGFRRQFQHRPVQADIADSELRGVNADRKATRTGVEVIARQGALVSGIERAVGIECQRMRGDHRSLGNQLPHLGFDFAVMHLDCSYPNSGPATANGSSAGVVVARPKRMR